VAGAAAQSLTDDPDLSSKKNSGTKPDRGEIIAVIKRVLAENGREYKRPYIIATFCMIAVGLTTAFPAWVISKVIDDVFYRQDTGMIALICLGIVGAFTIKGVAGYGQAVILAKVGNNLVARYQRRMFDHLMKLDVGFYSQQRSGHLAAQINQNVGGIRDLLSMTLTAVARDSVSLISLVALMFWQDPLLSAAAFLIGPPLVISVNYLMRRLRSITRQAVEINSRLIGSMQEATQGITVVKAFTMEDQLSRRMIKMIDHAEERSNKIARVSERLTPIVEILAGIAVAGIVAYAGFRAAYTGQPPGSIVSFITALLLAYDPVRRLAKLQVGLERSLVNARMIYEILDLTPQQGDAPDAEAIKVGKGEVRFDNVSFAYGEDLPVLTEVSFVAEAGKTTAIVGASGAGKTTLTALLERFYDLDGGSIIVDGQDISKVTKHSLRSAIAYVSQQPYLFEGTIADNIRYGREDATDDEIRFAAMQAAADEFIRQQPNGYDTAVGENGVTLSGGQRQRVSIARAIVRNAPILLLDEATSALDNESEARVQEALTTIMKGRTTIVIAHRLSTVINADRIVVMEAGRVIEQGTHEELLANPQGTYARFYRLQNKKGLDLVDDTAQDEPSSLRAEGENA
jgi:ATP-binding cassette, subfamily B, bacterial MsbA